MTEQPQQPGKDASQPPVSPMKSAAPNASTSEVSKQFLQTAIVWVKTTAVRLRPTGIALLGTIASLSQQGKQQLELQEKNAASQGQTVAPIDWTPVTKLADRFWTAVQPIWKKILVAARPRLPISFQPLDDRALSGIFAGTLLLILWFFSALPSGQAAVPPDRSPERNSEQRSPYARTFSKRPPSPKPVSRPYDSQSMPIADLSAPSQMPQTPVRSQPVAKPIAPIAVAQTPVQTLAQTPVSQPAILNPEASRRLQLRQNLDLIANALVPQSIVGIRPNDRSQSLTITLSDAWYRSPEESQTNLSNSLLVIAQGQGYSRLQLEDTEGTVIARNPVVGDGMIVVQRSR